LSGRGIIPMGKLWVWVYPRFRFGWVAIFGPGRVRVWVSGEHHRIRLRVG